MTTLVTRARLLSTVLRTGDVRRIRRIIGRFEARELTHLLAALDQLDLRRMANALCDAEVVDHTVSSLDIDALAHLMLAASPDDLRALLRALALGEPRRAASALLALPVEARLLALEQVEVNVRKTLIRALPRRARPKTSEDGLGAALRLRRLFA